MPAFGKQHPVLFEVALVVASFVAAALFVVAGSILGLSPDLSSSVARIIVAVGLMVIFQEAIGHESPLDGLALAVPALLFAVWNLFYNLSSGQVFGGPAVLLGALITAAAPALFEEVLFRGIFIYNLKDKGSGALACMLISAVVFSAIHATNIVGMDLASVGVQLAYALVIGMVLAAIYLRNDSIAQVIAIHFLIDFTNRIYDGQPTTSSPLQLGIFAVLLVAGLVYAVRLTTANN